MKKLLLSFTLLCIVVVVTAQEPSYLQLRKEYRSYCNEIVIDTITQSGTVKYEIGDGLKLIPKDTVWHGVDCREYINEGYWDGNLLIGGSISTTSGLILTNAVYDSYPQYSKPSVETFTTKITRDKYCQVKQERETEEGFWEWVNKNYLNK